MREQKMKAWLDLNVNWTRNKKVGQKSVMADLTILFCSDASEWDHYLTQCLLQVADSDTLNISHECLESLVFPLTSQKVHQFMNSKATLAIISPDFLDFVEDQAEVFELGKLLKSTGTVAMLCGVRESDVNHIHKAALVSYDAWPKLSARDQDKEFVLDVIKCTQDILVRTEENRTLHKPKFKLTPRKVKLGHNKVYILLNQSVDSTQKVQVFLEGDGVREVPAKTRNPFTLQFLVPEQYLQTSRLLNVHVRLADNTFLGIHPLKVESQMGELFNLLSSVNSPYELLCSTNGVATHREVDRLLADGFAQRVPFGFSLLENPINTEKKKSEEELPSLLHFAARYGMQELLSQILLCPGALQASVLRNARGLTPTQMASHAGHHNITAILEEFQKRPSPLKGFSVERDLTERRTSSHSTQANSYVNMLTNEDAPCDHEEAYDVPSRVAVRVLSLSDVIPISKAATLKTCPIDPYPNVSCSIDEPNGETGYIDMRILRVFGKEKLSTSEALEIEKNSRQMTKNGNFHSEPREELVDIIVSDGNSNSPEEPDPEGQQELAQIIERFKKGVPLNEVEKEFNIWQTKHRDSEVENSVIGVKDTHAKEAKHKHGFNFADLKCIVLSKFSKKESTPSDVVSPRPAKKSMLAEKIIDEMSNRPVSTLSTSSSASRASTLSSDRFSALSFGSTYDSGHHSDSYEEGNKEGNRDLKAPSSPDNRVNSHMKLSKQRSISSRPPAPPPRPVRLKPQKLKAPDINDPDRVYLNQNELPECNISPEYVAPDYQSFASPDYQNFVSPRSWNNSKTVENMITDWPPKAVTKWKSNSGDYYEVPFPSTSFTCRIPPPPGTRHIESVEDYSFPSSIPCIPKPREASHGDYYDVPRLPVLPLDSNCEERCGSIPEEMAPPPPSDKA